MPRTPYTKPATAKTSRSRKAGLVFPVSRMARHMRQGRYSNRLSGSAPVYLAAVLEYLAAEVMELAGNAARDNNRSRIVPRHLQLAIRSEEELNRLLHNVTLAASGVIPHIHMSLLPKGAKDKDFEEAAATGTGTSTPKKKREVTSSSKARKVATTTSTSTTSGASEEAVATGTSAKEGEGPGKYVWQYFDKTWRNYDGGASAIVEGVYQEYLLNPDIDVRAVKSGDWQYQVDFTKMEQTNIVHANHTARKIRRHWQAA